MMLQGVWVDALCISSAPECRMSEKGGGGRQCISEEEFRCRTRLCTYCPTNHVFPPQRYAHMIVYALVGRLVRLVRK